MEKIKIIITGSKSGNAEYNVKMDEGEVLVLKMALAKREVKTKGG